MQTPGAQKLSLLANQDGGWFRNVSPDANFRTLFYRRGLDAMRDRRSGMRPTFIAEYLDRFGAHRRVHLERGAWDTGQHHGWDFTQWQGSPAQRDTMSRVHIVSQKFHHFIDATAGAELSRELRRILDEAHWHVLRAETSCNFFWGDAWLYKVHKDLDDVEWHLGEASAILEAECVPPSKVRPPDLITKIQ